MQNNHTKRHEREPLVKELYGLGLTAREITTMVDWSEATVVSDIRRLGGLKAFPNRPTKSEIFPAVIRCYAEIVRDSPTGPHPVRDAIAKWLPESEFQAMLCGIALMTKQLSMPSYPTEKRGHVRLIREIFNVQWNDHLYDHQGGVADFWVNFFCEIADDVLPTPKGRGQLCQMLAKYALAERRAQIMPIWDDEVFSLIDGILSTLHPHEYRVIQLRFGLGNEKPLTFNQIAEVMSYPTPGPRQLEVKAMRKLRKEVFRQRLAILIQPVGDALQRILTSRRQAKEDAIRLFSATETDVLELLKEKTEDLRLSVRATNLLVGHKLEYIGQVVQQSEAAYMKTKYFGRKYTRELKKNIEGLGFSLGMTAETNPALAKFNEFLKNSQ
ncbi:MAG: DNA-directed RNA polymerase subunit alpha C-terminal domain-containing protein [Patescibacteria group bacterium]